MTYKIIFTGGYEDDLESLTKELKCDVLILDKDGRYYNPQFITLARIKGEFTEEKVCYLEDCLVILHTITKENIIKSVFELHNWQFQKRWIPLSEKQLTEYFYPNDKWLILEVEA